MTSNKKWKRSGELSHGAAYNVIAAACCLLLVQFGTNDYLRLLLHNYVGVGVVVVGFTQKERYQQKNRCAMPTEGELVSNTAKTRTSTTLDYSRGRSNSACVPPDLFLATTATRRKHQRQQQKCNLKIKQRRRKRIKKIVDPDLPLWLSKYYDDSMLGNKQQTEAKQQELENEVALELERFKCELENQVSFSWSEIDGIIQTMLWKSAGRQHVLKGMIDFCRLLLSSLVMSDQYKEPSQSSEALLETNAVFVASVIHFADCIAAREEGVYNWMNDHREYYFHEQKLISDTSSGSKLLKTNIRTRKAAAAAKAKTSETTRTELVVEENYDIPTLHQPKQQLWPMDSSSDMTYDERMKDSSDNDSNANHHKIMEIRRIANGAFKIKRVEILAYTILGINRSKALSKEEATTLRGLYLSTMDDYRSLAIRCVACLFRLEGILQEVSSTTAAKEYQERPAEVVQIAKEALKVYATLAQRLGLHQLKVNIEGKAFQILYRRQYSAVSMYYGHTGGSMNAIRTFLSQRITEILQTDEILKLQLEEVQVTSRVKEPFSFWKKVMKKRSKQQKKKQESAFLLPQGDVENNSSDNAVGDRTNNQEETNSEEISPSTSTKTSASTSSATRGSNLSMFEVPDGVALRVILRARKLSPDESDETTRTREKMLCYYVQHLLQGYWPALPDRMKDYIRNPKANGYQSLHFTAIIPSHNYQSQQQQQEQQPDEEVKELQELFPFEVQVRSKEMHHIAEYGVAAHWDYKLDAAAAAAAAPPVSGSPTRTLAPFNESNNNNDKKISRCWDDSVGGRNQELNDVDCSRLITSGGALQQLVMTSSSTRSSITNLEDGNNNTTTDSYIEAIVSARQNLVQQQVYVFVAGGSLLEKHGQLVTLPLGAQIRDALHLIDEQQEEEQQFKHVRDDNQPTTDCALSTRASCFQVWRNGKEADVEDRVENGDVLLFQM